MCPFDRATEGAIGSDGGGEVDQQRVEQRGAGRRRRTSDADLDLGAMLDGPGERRQDRRLLDGLPVANDDQPAWWQLGGPLLLGGLGLGLAAPPLVNVVLAAVPGPQAGSAGGVLSTVNQIGGSVGVAALGTLFFTRATNPSTSGPAGAFGDAFADVLSWQVGLYLIAAALMTLLPAATHTDQPAPGFNTISGFMLHHLDGMPAEADHVVHHGFRFEIVDMDGQRIDKILVSKIPAESLGDTGENTGRD